CAWDPATGTLQAMPRRPRSAALLLSAVVGLSLLPAGRAAAASPDFPAGWEHFHTYAEMSAEIAATAAAHPKIVQRFSIGKSHQGRELWAVKVSDNVAVDESEPEVLYDGLHHGDEHMSLEMTLAILRWLVQGYGRDERVTRVVDSREIWILFAVNPDGAEYDISGGTYQRWRKNRQPTPGTTSIGTDLNRNYDYRWGGSATPSSRMYQGPAAFSAPETRAVRDFLASRVVGGLQQIRVYATFHEYGRLVMWPYGYTTADLPADMTADDLAAFRKMGRAMAASNGYTPQQASDLYVTTGTSRDYAFGRYRIFAFTFELSTKDYPGNAWIPGETGRNRDAVLYLAERAWCPYGALGATIATARCGVFDDDLEVWRSWRVNPLGTDTASSGTWRQGDPAPTSSNGPKQLGTTTSGRFALATGLAAGSSANSHDLDGGRTMVDSRSFRVHSALGQRLTFRWSFAHDARATSADEFRVQVVPSTGSVVTVLAVKGSAVDRDGAWRTGSVSMDRWVGQTVRLRFSATDAGADNLVEAAFDDVRVTRPG
ncbi:MAG TPA: M14 family metallopeptidase, partial [Vitreimonas sp.]|nr:M14 family metallopeptidase [Vitreimonas sp.]